MAYSLADIARLVDGTAVGDPTVSIRGVAVLMDAGPGDVTLIDNAEKAARLGGSQAAAAIVPRGVTCEKLPTVEVADIHAAFARLIMFFRPQRKSKRIGISSQATISDTARVGRGVDIHPGATIGDDVEIGDGCTIHAGVQIMAGCKLGRRQNLSQRRTVRRHDRRPTFDHSCRSRARRPRIRLQVGRRAAPTGQPIRLGRIGADVEVGAGATIDRGTYGPTVIGEGTKIDNLVMVAHNCRIGRHNMLCSQVGIAGSTTTGDYVVMAGQVGVRDHVHIGQRGDHGRHVRHHCDVPAGLENAGHPRHAGAGSEMIQGTIAKLPELRRQIKALQAAVAQLQQDAAQQAGRLRTGLRKSRVQGSLLNLATRNNREKPGPIQTMTPSNLPAGTRNVGILAGWGRYPVVIAEALRAQGYEVHCLASRGMPIRA